MPPHELFLYVVSCLGRDPLGLARRLQGARG
jgi:hypothetical protein